MALADRDYYRPESEGPPPAFAGAPVTKALLIANVIVFGLTWILRSSGGGGGSWASVLDRWGWFTVQEGLFGLQVWRLITFQFLHANLLHILFNMYALFVFGPIVERWWRSRPFLAFYLISGMMGALFFALLWAVPGVLEGARASTPLVGASAGIFGILIAVAVIAPEERVILLFPPIPMKMRTYAIGILALGTYIVLVGGRNAGGEAGHLGGALAGFLMMVVTPLRNLISRLDPRTVRLRG